MKMRLRTKIAKSWEKVLKKILTLSLQIQQPFRTFNNMLNSSENSTLFIAISYLYLFKTKTGRYLYKSLKLLPRANI